MTKETYGAITNTAYSIASIEITRDALVKLKKSMLETCDHTYPNGIDARTYDADGAYCEICERLV